MNKKKEHRRLHNIEAFVSYAVSEKDLEKILESLMNPDIIKLMKMLFELPENSERVLEQLKSAKLLATRLDSWDFSDLKDVDKAEEILDKLWIMTEQGQGLQLYDMCRLETLYAFLSAILLNTVFKDLEDVIDGWIAILSESV